MELLKTICGLLLLSMSALSFAGTVNINTADADTIAQQLTGVGYTKAALVVDYRNTNGPFVAIDDIALVKGIGQRTIELNRERIVIE